MESSRLFAIDEQRDLNGYYLLAIILESPCALDLSQLSTAFYLFRNPYLLRFLAPERWAEIKPYLSEYELSNISSELVIYSPSALNLAFKSALGHLAQLGLLEAEQNDGKLLYSPAPLPAPAPIPMNIRTRAQTVTQAVQNKAPDRLREQIQEALRRHAESPSLSSPGLY